MEVMIDDSRCWVGGALSINSGMHLIVCSKFLSSVGLGVHCP